MIDYSIRYPVICPECGKTRDVSRASMLTIKSGKGSARCRECGHLALSKSKKVHKGRRPVYPYQCPVCWGTVTRAHLRYSSIPGRSGIICKECRTVLNAKANVDKHKFPVYQYCDDCGHEFSTGYFASWYYRKSNNGEIKCKKCRLLDRIKLREGRKNRKAEFEAERGRLHSEYYTFVCSTGCLLTRKHGEAESERCKKFTECANKSICLFEISVAWDGFSSDYAGFKKHIDPMLQQGNYNAVA